MKLPTIFYEQAVKSLRPNADWANKNGELIYFDDDCPTDIEIEKKAQELQADYDSKQYQRDRNYSSVGEQLDMIYWDKKNGTKKWEEAIDKVKSDHPKPSEK